MEWCGPCGWVIASTVGCRKGSCKCIVVGSQWVVEVRGGGLWGCGYPSIMCVALGRFLCVGHSHRSRIWYKINSKKEKERKKRGVHIVGGGILSLVVQVGFCATRARSVGCLWERGLCGCVWWVGDVVPCSIGILVVRSSLLGQTRTRSLIHRRRCPFLVLVVEVRVGFPFL